MLVLLNQAFSQEVNRAESEVNTSRRFFLLISQVIRRVNRSVDDQMSPTNVIVSSKIFPKIKAPRMFLKLNATVMVTPDARHVPRWCGFVFLFLHILYRLLRSDEKKKLPKRIRTDLPNQSTEF